MSSVPNISTLPATISKKKIVLVTAAATAVVVAALVLRSRLGAETVEVLTEA